MNRETLRYPVLFSQDATIQHVMVFSVQTCNTAIYVLVLFTWAILKVWRGSASTGYFKSCVNVVFRCYHIADSIFVMFCFPMYRLLCAVASKVNPIKCLQSPFGINCLLSLLLEFLFLRKSKGLHRLTWLQSKHHHVAMVDLGSLFCDKALASYNALVHHPPSSTRRSLILGFSLPTFHFESFIIVCWIVE